MTQPQPQQGVTYAPPDDEISLVELWQILVKRKRVFFAVFAVCLLLGTAYAFLKPAVYESRIALRIGQTNGELLEAGEIMSAQLMAQHGEEIADGVLREHPFLKIAAPKKGAPATVALVAEGNSPTQAADLLDRIARKQRPGASLPGHDRARATQRCNKKLGARTPCNIAPANAATNSAHCLDRRDRRAEKAIGTEADADRHHVCRARRNWWRVFCVFFTVCSSRA